MHMMYFEIVGNALTVGDIAGSTNVNIQDILDLGVLNELKHLLTLYDLDETQVSTEEERENEQDGYFLPIADYI